ncbi:4Fe-4S binding protein [bacterium]|nr:4Fe-4S binding protein [bacterium]
MPAGRGRCNGQRRGRGGGRGFRSINAGGVFERFEPQGRFIPASDLPESSFLQTGAGDLQDEITTLKRLSESVQSRIEEINERIRTGDTHPPLHRVVSIDEDVCLGCGKCIPICPRGAIELADRTARIDRERCTGCGLCVSECPAGAIRWFD